MPPKDAVAFFRKKGFAIGFAWEDVWREEHQRAFSVAKVTQMDILTDIREAVDEALEVGTTFAHFQARLEPILKEKGWWGKVTVFDPIDNQNKEAILGTPRRLKTIYDTNLRTAHTEGQWARIQERKGDFPLLVYDANNSAQPRHTHSAWDKLVLPADDPWWQLHMPVKEWGCKCRIRQMSESQAKRRGLEVSDAPKEKWRDYTNRRTGETIQVPDGVHPAFHYPPASRGEAIQKHYTAKKAATEKRLKQPINEPVTGVLKDKHNPVFSTIKGVNRDGINEVLAKVPGNDTQVEALSAFLDAHPIKSLFLKGGQMARGQAARKIETDVVKFLGDHTKGYGTAIFTVRNARRVGGFTSKQFDHVVIKGKATAKASKVDAEKLPGIVSDVLKKHAGDKKAWSVTEVAKQFANDDTGLMTTWAHEIGHQVHFYAGTPGAPSGVDAITLYSRTNAREWHAEHFVLWLYNRDALAAAHPVIAKHFDELLKKATRSTTK